MAESKLVRLFPKLHDISPFLVKEHPVYHPDTMEYTKYWEEHEKRCIEGYWGLDKKGSEGGWRFIPPQLYYYVNFCVIEDENEENNSSLVINPLLRDIEWIIFCNWLICRGFSGFENDNDYTCNTLIQKVELKELLTAKDKLRLQTAKNILKKDGSYKKYIDPREYLYQTHSKALGRPLYGNTAKNIFVLTSRGLGKSFIEMALISHTFKFHGATRFDNEYFNIIKGPEIVVGSALASKSSDLLSKFSFNEEYQKNNYGSWGEDDEFIPGYFHLNTSGTLVVSTKSPYRHEYEVKEGGVAKIKGSKTKIYHVTYMDNPNAAVGKRPILLIVEEVGLEANLFKVHAANETCFIRRNKTGTAGYFGTGGDIDKIAEPKAVFEDPESYDMLPFPDLWENRKKPIGLFIPAYYTDNSFRDQNGNQDIEAAYEQEMYERSIRASADSSSALDGYMMARPLVPSEMFLSASSNIFPKALLRDCINNLEHNRIEELFAYQGELEWTDVTKSEVKLIVDKSKKLKHIIYTNLDMYKNNLRGCIRFYEAPEENIPDPTYNKSLYKVVYDPIKDDITGTSLASIIVYKGVSENNWSVGVSDDIVAVYKGRYDKVEDIHDLAIKLATYYNAKIMVETNIPDFVRYAKRENKGHLLQRKPYETILTVVKNPGKKYDVGIDMTAHSLHVQAEQLIRQWLLTPWKTLDSGIVLLNAHKIKSLSILLELSDYDRSKNSDHISALKLLFLWLAQDNRTPIKEDREQAVESLDVFYSKLTKKTLLNEYYNY